MEAITVFPAELSRRESLRRGRLEAAGAGRVTGTSPDEVAAPDERELPDERREPWFSPGLRPKPDEETDEPCVVAPVAAVEPLRSRRSTRGAGDGADVSVFTVTVGARDGRGRSVAGAAGMEETAPPASTRAGMESLRFLRSAIWRPG